MQLPSVPPGVPAHIRTGTNVSSCPSHMAQGTLLTNDTTEAFLAPGFDLILAKGDRTGERLRADRYGIVFKGVRIGLDTITGYGHQAVRRMRDGVPARYLWELTLEFGNGGRMRTRWGVEADAPSQLKDAQQHAYDYLAVLLHTGVRPRLVEEASRRIATEGSTELAGVTVTRDGFWPDGADVVPWQAFGGAPIERGSLRLMTTGAAGPSVLAEIPMATPGALVLAEVLRETRTRASF